MKTTITITLNGVSVPDDNILVDVVEDAEVTPEVTPDVTPTPDVAPTPDTTDTTIQTS
jgi:hypothetical protein